MTYVKNNKSGKKGLRVCLICKDSYPAVQIPGTILFRPHDACIGQLYNMANQKLRKQSEKQKRIDRRELKDGLRTKSDYFRDLQLEINRIVRLVDKGCPCISSNRTTGKFNAGHFHSVGSNAQIRFNTFNIYLQTEHDNSYKSGNIIGYREGLLKTFGAEHLNYVEGLKNMPPLNLSIEEVKVHIKTARQIVKELKSDDLTYTVEQRLTMRKEINERLNIYK